MCAGLYCTPNVRGRPQVSETKLAYTSACLAENAVWKNRAPALIYHIAPNCPDTCQRCQGDDRLEDFSKGRV